MTAWEPRDLPPRAPGLAIVGVFLLIGAAAALTAGELAAFAGHRAPDRASALQRAAQPPPPPRLQTAPWRDLRAARDAAAARLDHPSGPPIDAAMRQEAGRGWVRGGGR